MTSLFKLKKARVSHTKPAWKHKFMALSCKDQNKVPTTEIEKEELIQSGLGEMELEFPSLEMTTEEFKEFLFSAYPLLREGGGYQFMKCIPNTRKLEPLPTIVHTSPSILKQRVGSARTYIKPLQRDIDLYPVPFEIGVCPFQYNLKYLFVQPLEECLTCGDKFPLHELYDHAEECSVKTL